MKRRPVPLIDNGVQGLRLLAISTVLFAAPGGGGMAATVTHSTSPAMEDYRLIEDEIARALNAYRAELGLPPIPRSRSLDMVARAHISDLVAKHPDEGVDTRGVACNTHSWSSSGDWTPVCYTGDHIYASRMWSKPTEVTKGAYRGQGFEIAMSGSFNAASALAGWKASPAHNAVIVQQGQWSQVWRAFGVGVGPGYAVVWFGREADTVG